jgi:DNA-binding helix-hairpin-helix protein with protein kinase domain
MQLRRSSNGQPVSFSLAATLGVGGEARIFAVADAPGLAAKVYHRPMREHAAKLVAMLANPPEDPMASQGQVSIAWPTDLLVSVDGSDQVMGFLMPRVTEMHPIIDFYHPKTRRKKHPLFSYQYLLRTARNLATCVSALHARGYVIGDLNESNILVGESALVSLVDTDSFQVPDPHNGQVYRCRVGKPEFTPPELQSVKFAWVDRRPEQDLFGLGVLFFQLLMEGIHPFAGRHAGPGESPPLEERIAAGFFPYGPSQSSGTLPMPTAPQFEMLDPRLRDLLIRCFVDGHSDPSSRPSAQSWQLALLEAESSLTACSVNDQHRYGSHLAACPWCQRQHLLRELDPFPSRQAVKERRHLRRILKGRKPIRAPSIAYETAIAIALATIARRRWQRVIGTILLVLLGIGLLAYWCWALG